MSELGNKLKIVLADTFALHLKAWNYHWNVEGPDFYQYHEFFSQIYSDLQSAIDPIAEHIRAIGEYAPGGLKRYADITIIEDELALIPPKEAVNRLLADNNIVIGNLTTAYHAAESASEFGLSNFLQDRIDAHKKLGWMLRASIKSQ